jgi:Fic family protein
MMHYQFEAIHPYWDGNGRIGRLLIILFLCSKEVLPKPLLYLSAYFERFRHAYYDNLFAISATGDWKPWLRFFLDGVAQEANDALIRSRRVRSLQDQYRGILRAYRETSNAFSLLDALFANPYMTARRAANILDVTTAGARRLLDRLAEAGLVRLDTHSWPRLYVAAELLAAIESPIAQ